MVGPGVHKGLPPQEAGRRPLSRGRGGRRAGHAANWPLLNSTLDAKGRSSGRSRKNQCFKDQRREYSNTISCIHGQECMTVMATAYMAVITDCSHCTFIIKSQFIFVLAVSLSLWGKPPPLYPLPEQKHFPPPEQIFATLLPESKIWTPSSKV